MRRRRPLNGKNSKNSKNSKKWSAETVYAVTSLTAIQGSRPSPAQLAAIMRGHWLIEDSLH